jgi:hypothetical protein
MCGHLTEESIAYSPLRFWRRFCRRGARDFPTVETRCARVRHRHARPRRLRPHSPNTSLSHLEGGSIPAAALTAYATSEDRLKALLAGFQIHVTKPVDPLELIAVVASLAGRTGTAKDKR